MVMVRYLSMKLLMPYEFVQVNVGMRLFKMFY